MRRWVYLALNMFMGYFYKLQVYVNVLIFAQLCGKQNHSELDEIGIETERDYSIVSEATY